MREYHRVEVRDGEPFFIDVRYQVLSIVGDGSYGIVVRALDTQTNTHVAIKKVQNVFSDLIDAKRVSGGNLATPPRPPLRPP